MSIKPGSRIMYINADRTVYRGTVTTIDMDVIWANWDDDTPDEDESYVLSSEHVFDIDYDLEEIS